MRSRQGARRARNRSSVGMPHDVSETPQQPIAFTTGRLKAAPSAAVDSAVSLVYGRQMFSRFVMLTAVALLLPAPPASAQLLAQDHPGQYTQEDIARGNLLYTAQCFQCHGRDGDQISGVDLRRGLFRRVAVRRGPGADDYAWHTGRDAAVQAGSRRAHGHHRLHSGRVRHERLGQGGRRGSWTGASSTARASARPATAWPARARARRPT